MKVPYDFDASNDGFYLEYNSKPMQESIKKEHVHGAWEFYFYLGDNMTFFLNETSYNVKKYDLVFVDRYLYHKTHYKNKERDRILVLLRKEFFTIFKDREQIYEYLLNICNLSVLSFDDKVKHIIYEKFLRLAEFYENHSDDEYKLQIFFTDILATINHYIETKRVCRGAINNSKNSLLASQITGYINNHYPEKITLDYLADIFFVDKFHLCHIFRKETGITVIDYINQKRIVEAAILLRTTNKKISDISNIVGFSNQNYFGVMFKKQYGKTPREYRLLREPAAKEIN